MALVAEAMGKPAEALTLASNVLDQANALLETSSRKDREALQGRARALSMLARLNEGAGVTELARQYQADARVAADECKQSGAGTEDQANVFRQNYAAPVWQEPWAVKAGATGGVNRWGDATYSHGGRGLWLQATQPRDEANRP